MPAVAARDGRRFGEKTKWLSQRAGFPLHVTRDIVQLGGLLVRMPHDDLESVTADCHNDVVRCCPSLNEKESSLCYVFR